jgi:predicted amidophosphoribosyltransferase
VLLVDDVATTGSTLREAARALADAGAERIAGLVLARRP